jgi:DNA polymerase-3 subunit beta
MIDLLSITGGFTMKFKVQQDELIHALSLVTTSVERRGTLPILGNLMLKLDGDKLHVTGTDLEVETTASIRVEVIEVGSVTVPAKKLFDIVRALPSDNTITFSFANSDKAVVTSGRGRYTLQTLNAKDFPSIDDFKETHSFPVSTESFARLLTATVFSMAVNDVRYFLNGVLLHIDGGVLRAVATDGHRLAYSASYAECESVGEVKLILPRKGVTELQKVLAMAGDSVTLSLSDNHLRVTGDNLTFTTKLVDGNYPDYNRVIPQNGDKEVVVNKSEIKSALSRAAILSNEKFRGVRLTIKDGYLELEANNPEQEEAKEVVDIVSQHGDTLEIGFNVNYLLDAINAIPHNEIKITFGDANTSALIESQEKSDSIYICMPMRL